jgi:hypothetical protein
MARKASIRWFESRSAYFTTFQQFPARTESLETAALLAVRFVNFLYRPARSGGRRGPIPFSMAATPSFAF